MESRNLKSVRKTNKMKWIYLSLLILIMMAGVGYLFRKELSIFAFNSLLKEDLKTSLDKSYKAVGYEDSDNQSFKNEPFSLLLLGIDQRGKEASRSDTIIYSVIRPKDNKVLLVSIPRDTYTEIIGRDVKSKINSAFAYGEEKMSIDTVENLLKTKVNYYGTVNFNAIINLVDAVGGVKLPITEVIENKNPVHIKLRIDPNKLIYDGQDALNYVRYREDSDFKRTERQRIFIKSMMDKVLELKNITKVPDLIDIAGSNFTTNMHPDFIFSLAETLYLNDTPPDFESYMLHGNGKMIGSTWYYDVDTEDLDYTQNLISNWLDSEIDKENLMLPNDKN
ncbi:LCP family protein [Paenibacillus sp. JSM ZJ436]